ncbi:MAG: hypothetical protein FRX48_03283 [Lasallia pustulata]|uniref:Uncharacterized protein n=1 Tax=Lasallia pustulata TaxID=136370 RepID=A0A5M8PX85_9LECA|nr:MAG: hypothetical protein FRX48_03283 [Lasallia pustulata]
MSSNLPWSLRRHLPCYPHNYHQTSFDHDLANSDPAITAQMLSQGSVRYDHANLKGDGTANLVWVRGLPRRIGWGSTARGSGGSRPGLALWARLAPRPSASLLPHALPDCLGLLSSTGESPQPRLYSLQPPPPPRLARSERESPQPSACFLLHAFPACLGLRSSTAESPQPAPFSIQPSHKPQLPPFTLASQPRGLARS